MKLSAVRARIQIKKNYWSHSKKSDVSRSSLRTLRHESRERECQALDSDAHLAGSSNCERKNFPDATGALVQIAGGAEICSINKDTLFIEQDRIPDRGHSGILGPESTEVEPINWGHNCQDRDVSVNSSKVKIIADTHLEPMRFLSCLLTLAKR